MNSKPIVSGITIFFNAERFFVEAIESILAQTFDDWELLLVDDGSTDKSTEIALHYAAKYPNKIRYLEHPYHQNLGMSVSRNLGIKNARGEFVAFLDADDVWVSHKLEQQLKVMREQPDAAMCYGPTMFWHSWAGNDEDVGHDWHTQHGPQVNSLVAPPSLLILLLRDEFTVPSTCSILFRRDIANEIGMFEENFRDQMEDMVFHTKIFLNRPVFVSTECWGLYRQHQNNNGKLAMAMGLWLPHAPNPARRAYLKWVGKYLNEQNIQNDELWNVLSEELQPYS